ncbi:MULTISPECIES: hypothetical protein [unclassified Bradyrhizobium]|uniref:hypothetical protein n=1 Tax=unclassified Bradyrhizobium TaxID=2631580 RepID=UPI002916024F|nr:MULTISPECIES: hypothetical protein [unclassified Bradyrhizobium]
MKATTDQTTVRLIPHEESFEVRISHYFYFDDNAGRRSINGRADRKTAQSAAQAFARAASPPTSETPGTTIDLAAAIVAAWKREHGLPLLSPEASGELAGRISAALREAYEAGREEAP